jgi:ABC-type molybdate transport system substrate-binding protein
MRRREFITLVPGTLPRTEFKAAMDELLPPFERANGHTVLVSYGPSGALIPRFNGGTPADIFVVDSAAIDELIKQGKIVSGRTDLARTWVISCTS